MHLYCMCQTLVFNAINTIATDIECNIRIDRLPLGRGTDLGQSVYPIVALHISNYYIINDMYNIIVNVDIKGISTN
jgi:hypothetical protein